MAQGGGGAGSKTEKATPKRRKDERKKGNVFQSKDVVNAFSVLVVFLVLKLIFPYMYHYLSNFLTRYIGYISSSSAMTTTFANQIFREAAIGFFLLAGPVLLAAMLIGTLASGVQTRFIFSRETIKFKFSYINPLSGLKRLFSLRSAVELLKSLLKTAVIAFVLYTEYREIFKTGMSLIYMDVSAAVVLVLNAIIDIVFKLSVAFFIIAAADYLYQWWDHEKKMKMTKQEIKEEYKTTEGDPQIKSKIREMQRRRSRSRMMQQVPKADVIVRNPTHYAIALKYDLDKNAAPLVVAKGQGYVALRIIDIAQEHEIPMTENPPLAQALYREVEVGREIPPEYYSALAEILAWVYSLKKDVKRH